MMTWRTRIKVSNVSLIWKSSSLSCIQINVTLCLADWQFWANIRATMIYLELGLRLYFSSRNKRLVFRNNMFRKPCGRRKRSMSESSSLYLLLITYAKTLIKRRKQGVTGSSWFVSGLSFRLLSFATWIAIGIRHLEAIRKQFPHFAEYAISVFRVLYQQGIPSVLRIAWPRHSGCDCQ